MLASFCLGGIWQALHLSFTMIHGWISGPRSRLTRTPPAFLGVTHAESKIVTMLDENLRDNSA